MEPKFLEKYNAAANLLEEIRTIERKLSKNANDISWANRDEFEKILKENQDLENKLHMLKRVNAKRDVRLYTIGGPGKAFAGSPIGVKSLMGFMDAFNPLSSLVSFRDNSLTQKYVDRNHTGPSAGHSLDRYIEGKNGEFCIMSFAPPAGDEDFQRPTGLTFVAISKDYSTAMEQIKEHGDAIDYIAEKLPPGRALKLRTDNATLAVALQTQLALNGRYIQLSGKVASNGVLNDDPNTEKLLKPKAAILQRKFAEYKNTAAELRQKAETMIANAAAPDQAELRAAIDQMQDNLNRVTPEQQNVMNKCMFHESFHDIPRAADPSGILDGAIGTMRTAKQSVDALETTIKRLEAQAAQIQMGAAPRAAVP